MLDMERARIIITEFLQYVDKNGVYTDENCDNEGVERMTFDEGMKYFYWFVNWEKFQNLGMDIAMLSFDDIRKYAVSMGLHYKTEMKFNLLTDEDDNFKVDWNWIINK